MNTITCDCSFNGRLSVPYPRSNHNIKSALNNHHVKLRVQKKIKIFSPVASYRLTPSRWPEKKNYSPFPFIERKIIKICGHLYISKDQRPIDLSWCLSCSSLFLFLLLMLLQRSHEGMLVLWSLEATVAKFGAGVNKLQLYILQSLALGVNQQRLEKKIQWMKRADNSYHMKYLSKS